MNVDTPVIRIDASSACYTGEHRLDDLRSTKQLVSATPWDHLAVMLPLTAFYSTAMHQKPENSGPRIEDAPIFDFLDSDLTFDELIHIGDHNRALYIKKCK